VVNPPSANNTRHWTNRDLPSADAWLASAERSRRLLVAGVQPVVARGRQHHHNRTAKRAWLGVKRTIRTVRGSQARQCLGRVQVERW
jgi:hypothetical protein